jgi:hypothetical protein
MNKAPIVAAQCGQEAFAPGCARLNIAQEQVGCPGVGSRRLQLQIEMILETVSTITS